jgi:hypothetical protein
MVPTVLVVLAASSPSRAERFSIGASLGRGEGEGGTDRVESRTVFARLQLSSRISVEAELGGVELMLTEYDTLQACPDLASCERPDPVIATGHVARGTVRLDLASGKGWLRPHVLVGFGVERWNDGFFSSATYLYSRRELGSGVDVRLTQGLFLGGDYRVGERRLEDTRDESVLAIYNPGPLPEDETRYAAARVTLTASF